jgi:hypothetical protein
VENLDARIQMRQIVQYRAGAIGRTVVHKDDLGGLRQAVESIA